MSQAQTQSRELELLKNNVAMTVTLISFGMMFATLFLGYMLVRFNSPVWPPVEIQGMPKLLPFLSTLVMALSSLCYYIMEKKGLTDAKTGKIFWSLTMVLGLVFLALQWTLWSSLKATGILVSNGMVPSMVYSFTWLHAAHIVLGLMVMMWLGRFVFRKREALTEFKVINVGKFWHFLGVVWLIMYLTLFVI